MRRALPRGLVGAPGATLLLGAAGLLLAAALFFSEASSPERLAWIGGAAILAAGASGAAALFGVLPVPRLGREGVAFVVLLAALVAWIGASIAWSAAPDRSWDNFNRGAVYLAFAVLGLLVAAVEPRAPRRVAGGLAALLAGVAVWALAGKVVPALYDDYGRFARLRSPVGYWNGLALLCALGFPLALWLAARRAHGLALRVAGVVLAYALVVAVFLTYSRGGLAAAAFAIGAWLVLTEERFESVGALAVALPSAIAVVALGLSLPGVAEDRQPRDVRVEDGAWFGVALVVGAILVAGLAVAAGRYEARRPLSAARRRLLLRGAAVAGAVAILVGGAALAVWGAGVNADVVPQDPSRIGAAGSNNRLDWWQEAWEAFEGEPLLGTGAGSFELVHRQLRDRPSNDVTEPHNLALRFLSETGLVGFLLTAGTAAAGLVGAWRALGRLEGDEREAAAALAVGVPTYLLHGLVDFDWDFVAVSAPVFFVLGLLLGRPGERLRRPLWAVGSALVALTALSSIAAPWLAERKVDEAYAAIERPEEAVDAARAAHRLNPLAVEPLLAWATAEEARGNVQRAGELYVEAVELQPLNAETWYELARFEIDQGDQERARRHLERARELDPFFAAAISLLNLIGAGE
jgi:tetratricopeptide (TPR) repeat protein